MERRAGSVVEGPSPGFLNSTNCDVLGVENGTKHVESVQGLIHLEHKVVAHPKWRERGIVGCRGSDAHRVPAPTPFGDAWNEHRGLEQCHVQRLDCIPDVLVLNKKGTDTKQASTGEIHVEHLWLATLWVCAVGLTRAHNTTRLASPEQLGTEHTGRGL